MVLFIIIILFGLMILGTPISFALGITSLLALLKLGVPAFLDLVPQRIYAGIDSFPLMAIPFFLLASELMSCCGLTNKLVNFANHLIGHLKGGLGHVNILASVLFAGITGAAVADVAAVGPIEIEMMTQAGYKKSYAAALTAASSVLGPIIPPSIIMVIYGSLMGVSIAAMFAAGILPGLLMALCLMIYNHYVSGKRGYVGKEKRSTIKEMVHDLPSSMVALLMPLIIMGGILSGVFTPTEAAAVAVVYALIVALFKRSFNFKSFLAMLTRTSSSVGMIFLVMGCASILGWILASERVPDMVAQAILAISNNKIFVLLLINLVLFITGMFMDIGVALVILAPILWPVAQFVGVNPLHFGIVMCINLNVGLITPPLGACIFVTCGVVKLKMEEMFKDIFPLLITEAIGVLVITYVPSITLTIPRLLKLI
jgi:tripartite ATP-independent transporter DctM subunit